LAARRGHRGSRAPGRPAPAPRGGLGRRGGARRVAGLRRRASGRRRERRPDARRRTLPQEGQRLVRRRVPGLRDDREYHELPDARGAPGVFLASASCHGMAFLDRAISLPRTWADDRPRREVAGIPKDVRFATKPASAKRLLTRAFAAEAPAGSSPTAA